MHERASQNIRNTWATPQCFVNDGEMVLSDDMTVEDKRQLEAFRCDGDVFRFRTGRSVQGLADPICTG